MVDVVIFLRNSSSQSCLKFNRNNLPTSPNPIKSHTNNSNPRSLLKQIQAIPSMLQQSLPNVDSSEFEFRQTSWVISSTQSPCRIRTCKTWCTGVPFTSWFRSSKIHEGKTSDWLRRWFGDWWNDWCWSPKKKARKPISINYCAFIFAIFLLDAFWSRNWFVFYWFQQMNKIDQLW